MGFTETQFVEATNPEEAERLIIESVFASDLTGRILNSDSDLPTVEVCEIEEVEEFEIDASIMKGRELFSMSEPEIPRWVQVPVGVVLSAFVFLCLAGSLMLAIAGTEKAPVVARILGTLMTVLSIWLLKICWRLIIGGKNRGGLIDPAGLRMIGWAFLLLPIGGIFSGYFRTNPIAAILQTVAYIAIFFSLRSIADRRERFDV